MQHLELLEREVCEQIGIVSADILDLGKEIEARERLLVYAKTVLTHKKNVRSRLESFKHEIDKHRDALVSETEESPF